jgi:hypothetical protein
MRKRWGWSKQRPPQIKLPDDNVAEQVIRSSLGMSSGSPPDEKAADIVVDRSTLSDGLLSLVSELHSRAQAIAAALADDREVVGQVEDQTSRNVDSVRAERDRIEATRRSISKATKFRMAMYFIVVLTILLVRLVCKVTNPIIRHMH